MPTGWQWAALGVLGVGIGASVLTKTFFYVIIAAIIAIFVSTLTSNLTGNAQPTITLPTKGVLTDVQWVAQPRAAAYGIFSCWANCDSGLSIWIGVNASTATKAVVFQIDLDGQTSVSTWDGTALGNTTVAANNFPLNFSLAKNAPYNLIQLLVQGSTIVLFGLSEANNTGINAFTVDQFIGGIPSNFVLQYEGTTPDVYAYVGFSMAQEAVDAGTIQNAQWIAYSNPSLISSGFTITAPSSQSVGTTIISDPSWQMLTPNNSQITFEIPNAAELFSSSQAQTGFSVIASPSLPASTQEGVLFEFFSNRDTECAGVLFNFVIRNLSAGTKDQCAVSTVNSNGTFTLPCTALCEPFGSPVDSCDDGIGYSEPPTNSSWPAIFQNFLAGKWSTLKLYAVVTSNGQCKMGYYDTSGNSQVLLTKTDSYPLAPALSWWSFSVDPANCPGKTGSAYLTSAVTVTSGIS